MKTIAIESQKGGVGKTTLAINLAVAAELDGKAAAIIDLDPQASATRWKELRPDKGPAVVSAQASRLKQMLNTAMVTGVDVVFIDTAPNSEGSILTAARLADLVLVPCKPGILDMQAIEITIDLIVNAAKKAPHVIMTMCPPIGGHGERSSAVIGEQYSVSIVPQRICHRAPYGHSLVAGQSVQEFEPEGKASQEIGSVYRWICSTIGV